VLCRNQLHPKDYPGPCRPCTWARQSRYGRSPKGRARTDRYWVNMPAERHIARKLKERRHKAEQRSAARLGRSDGALSTQG
jgi:hypothetical protein